ncbi:MAG: recombinase RecT [Pseudohongiellaceae bacterium]
MGELATLGDKVKRAPAGYKKLAPDYMAWQKEKLFLLDVVAKSKDLQKCEPTTLIHSMLQLGSMGLTLNPVCQHAYLIPRNERSKKTGESWDNYNAAVGKIAYPSPSYRGLVWLAEKSGKVNFIRADVVYSKDHFSYKGSWTLPEYTSGPLKSRNYKNAVGVFAVAQLQDGNHLCELIERDNIERIRSMSEMPDGIMWNPAKMWTEGWKKSAIRRLFKTTPVSDNRLEAAQHAMNTYEGIAIQHDAVPEISHINLDQQTVLSELLDQLGDDSRETFLTAYNAPSLAEFPAPLYEGSVERLNLLIEQKGANDEQS